MKDLIERKDAISAVIGAKLPDKTDDGIPIANGKRSLTDCVRRIREIPSAKDDVVHCKDCKFTKHDGNGCLYCTVWDAWEMPDDGFCYHARVKE